MPADHVKIVKLWWDRLNENRTPPLELCDYEIEISNPNEFPVRGTFRGHDGVRQWLDQAFEIVDELRMEVEDAIDAGDGETAVLMLRMHGLARHTRIPFDAPWAAVIRVRGGKVVRAQGYMRRKEALRAAGIADTD